MSQTGFSTITLDELERRLATTPPDNENRSVGYALVNVLKAEAFEDEHIPNSINIPAGEEDRFEQRFNKDKNIVVYCASPSCDASPKAARALADRGFRHVYDYEAGMSEWKNAGNEIAGGRV